MSLVAEKATVAWGYTMADLDRIAWSACRGRGWSGVLDTEERHAVAWHGVAVRLLEAEEAPTTHELYRAAGEALSDAVGNEFHTHGWNKKMAAEAPRFAAYWRPIKADRHDGFTDHLVETLALPVALSLLTERQYEAIVTLAAYDNDMIASARALGLSKSAFYHQVRGARDAIKAVWVGDDETPVARRMPTDTCRSGHDRAKHSRVESDGIRHCLECRRVARIRSDRRRREAQRVAARQLEDDIA